MGGGFAGRGKQKGDIVRIRGGNRVELCGKGTGRRRYRESKGLKFGVVSLKLSAERMYREYEVLNIGGVSREVHSEPGISYVYGVAVGWGFMVSAQQKGLL